MIDDQAIARLTVQLTLPIDPATLPTAQQKGVTRAGLVYTKARVRQAKRLLVEALREEAACARDLLEMEYGTLAVRRYHSAREGAPWSVAIEYVYSLKTAPKRMGGLPKATRPDLDNLTKLVLDALTESGVAFADDGQVAILQVRKRHARAGEDAHVRLVFEPAEGEGGRWTWL